MHHKPHNFTKNFATIPFVCTTWVISHKAWVHKASPFLWIQFFLIHIAATLHTITRCFYRHHAMHVAYPSRRREHDTVSRDGNEDMDWFQASPILTPVDQHWPWWTDRTAADVVWQALARRSLLPYLRSQSPEMQNQVLFQCWSMITDTWFQARIKFQISRRC